MFLKAALGLSGTIATAGLRAELPVATLASRGHTLKLLFWNKLCAAGTTRLLSRVFRHRHAQVVAGGAPLSALRPMMLCLQSFGFGAEWQAASICDRSVDEWGADIRAAVRADLDAREQAAIALRPSLSHFTRLQSQRTDTLSVPLDLSDHSNLAGSRLKTRLRLG